MSVSEIKLRNELFKALLRKNQGKKLGKNQKILIEAWELYKKQGMKKKLLKNVV
jgi:hypothetical protein